MEKVGRNDPCPCGSGKKFKKCCEEKVTKKKFEAQVITEKKEEITDKAHSLSARFFQKRPETPPAATPETGEPSNLNS
jgi:hypothetical protein